MPIRAIATSDSKSEQLGSYARTGVQIGGIQYCRWIGFANVLAGVTASSIDITIPSQQRGLADTVGLVLDARSNIQTIGIYPEGLLNLGTATGKLKFASSLASATNGLFVESAAASGGVLAVPSSPVIQYNQPSVSIGTNDLTFKLYATDGVAGAGAGASTVTATKDTRVIVCVTFTNYTPFPLPNEVPLITPKL